MGKDVQYENPATVRMPSYGFYARDAWQVSRKLPSTTASATRNIRRPRAIIWPASATIPTPTRFIAAAMTRASASWRRAWESRIA